MARLPACRPACSAALPRPLICGLLLARGRRRGQKVCVDADEVQEVLSVDGQQLKQVQVEASFSQPNGGMCQHMLSWARSATGGRAAVPLLV